MKEKEIYSQSGSSGDDRLKVVQSADGDFLVQGFAVDSEVQAAVKPPEGEDVIRLPKEFFEGMLAALSK